LFDDGTNGDQRAGDGIYTRRIKLPPTPRDYYVTIVPSDKAGNFPATSARMAVGTNSMVMPRRPPRGDHTQPDVRIIPPAQGEASYPEPNRQLCRPPMSATTM
jgi:hypothetical protein